MNTHVHWVYWEYWLFNRDCCLLKPLILPSLHGTFHTLLPSLPWNSFPDNMHLHGSNQKRGWVSLSGKPSAWLNSFLISQLLELLHLEGWMGLPVKDLPYILTKLQRIKWQSMRGWVFMSDSDRERNKVGKTWDILRTHNVLFKWHVLIEFFFF